MSDLLAAAAAKLGSPEHLVERSAAARAEADGIPVEDVLAAWAGGAPTPSEGSAADRPAVAATAPTPPAPEPAPPEPAVAPGPVTEPAAAEPATPATAAAATTAAPPPPERVTAAEAIDFEAVITGPTAGLTERIAAALPRWLMVLFFAVPLVGLTYLVTFANGPTCGVGGQLAVDRLSGAVENCDGSEFAAGGGAGGVDVRALIGEATVVYAAPSSCSSCHGAGGEGGSGPALAGEVLSTFAMCTDHIEWVSLGTTGFQSAGRTSYGDTGKAVGSGGQMPSFQDTLSDEEIAAVVFYERVVFGGQDVEEAVFDCGFAEPEDSEEGGEGDDSLALGE